MIAGCALLAGPVLAASGRYDLHAGRGALWVATGLWEGDVTYRIGGHVTDALGSYNVDFPISELKFPLNDVPFVAAGGDVLVSEHGELFAALAQGDSSYAGKMKDSDWTIAGIPEEFRSLFKTVYSESDAAVKTFKGDAGVRYWFESDDRTTADPFGVSLFGVGAGFLYESFAWDVSNLDQWYPLNPSLAHDRVAGLVGTYAAVIEMPYIGIDGRMEEEKYQLAAGLGYSPVARVTDEDHHILRAIRAKARTQGSAFKGYFGARYYVTGSLFCAATADFLFVDTAGTAATAVYAGPDAGQSWTIDHKVTAANYTVSFAVGVRY